MQRWELALCPLLAPVPELPTCRRASHPTSACYSVHPTSVILPQHHVKGQRTAHPDPSASGPQRWTHMPPGVHVTGWPVAPARAGQWASSPACKRPTWPIHMHMMKFWQL